jgi:predicted DNA-binding protein
MGRPPLPKECRRDKVFLFRMTVSEEERLRALAKSLGMTLSECIRLFVLSAFERAA